jgi:hypothetical protein
VAAYAIANCLAPGFDAAYFQDFFNPANSPLYSASTVSDQTFGGDPQQSSPFPYQTPELSPQPTKRQKLVNADSLQRSGGGIQARPPNLSMLASGGGSSAQNDAAVAATTTVVAVNKPKRVRTGCLTCRERHLKCDEGTPNCQNCRKSSRVCKRGWRLNFIDTKVEDVLLIPRTADWRGMSFEVYDLPLLT